MTHRVPRTLEAATRLLERFAFLDGAVAEIEEGRTARIAAVNSECDAAASTFVTERDEIVEKLSAWWPAGRASLLTGKRKSAELGGCEVGSRSGRAKLGVPEDVEGLIATMKGAPWSKKLLRVEWSLDKAAIVKELDGKRAGDLKTLGLSLVPGAETFFVKRTEQGGTIGKPA